MFDMYAENGTISLNGLFRFLIESQGEDDATKEDAQAIFDSLKQLKIFQRKGLQLDSLYLFGDLNPPIFPKVNHDMNAPLSHYFLFTGHNT
ncbi:hypothetical protein ACLB2K_030122 [Fragaria x ananassa]